MKLTNQDKAILKNGAAYPMDDNDLIQIERVLQKRYTKYRHNDHPISREQAIDLLGREKFLSGIRRSAFHFTAARPVSDNPADGVVYFDSSAFFKEM